MNLGIVASISCRRAYSLRMLRWTLFIFAWLFFGLSLLTVFKSPDWNVWQLALLAGEYGHVMAWVTAGMAATALVTRQGWGMLWPVTFTICGLATLLFLKPTIEAFSVGERARTELDRIGAPASPSRPFSIAGYFQPDEAEVPMKTLRYADALELDFYGAIGRSPAPCVVVVHGGGWDSGNRGQLTGLNHWLARRGYAVAAISYRLAPRFIWPAQRDDLLAALAYLKRHAEELGVDPRRLVLLGRSAGGQIAETVAYAAHDDSIRGVVGIYAPSDLRFAYKYSRDDDVLKSPALIRRFLGGAPDTAGGNFDSATALRQVSTGSPPTLLIHGENDTLVWHRHSVRLEALLEQARVPCVLVSLPWATHAFEYNLHGPGGQLTTYALERFLAKVTAE